jgi:hypothetical protein
MDGGGVEVRRPKRPTREAETLPNVLRRRGMERPRDEPGIVSFLGQCWNGGEPDTATSGTVESRLTAASVVVEDR